MTKKERKQAKARERQIGKTRDGHERIAYLLQAALAVVETSPDMARHYVTIIRTIIRRMVTRVDLSLSRMLCDGCNIVLVPPVSASVRVSKASRKTTCLHCGAYKTYSLLDPQTDP